ncbi:MAG: squalene/phytoene synthase family protein [Xanthomonadales bacterium]|nr:squalene/phytoene synthase family protein [Xanthomonadales bacterium]
MSADPQAWPDELQGRIDKWLHTHPQQRIALGFVDRMRYAGHYALLALEQEMLDAAYGAREPQVAATRLQWWVEELSAAPASGGHHPLTELLFADRRARSIAASTWTAPALAAIAQLSRGTAADFPAQLEAAGVLHGALATLETQWWYGSRASTQRATRVAVLGQLLHALRALAEDADRDCLPLPMVRLAQHGLNRERLRQPDPASAQAVRDQLLDLQRGLVESARMSGPLSVFRVVQWREARQSLAHALAAADSQAALAVVPARPGLWDTLLAWRTAAAWRQADPWGTGRECATADMANALGPDGAHH